MSVNSKLGSAARLLVVGALLGTGAATAAQAASSYDGRWTVGLRTGAGSCPSSRAVVVEVVNGQATYAGEEQVTASGTIPDSGKVSLRFTYNEDTLDARGSINVGVGTGSWTSNTGCSGTWSARRSG